jgi:hypothetical protein
MSFLWGINTTIYYCTIPSYSINIPFIEYHRWLNMYIYIYAHDYIWLLYIYCITLTFWDPNHFSCFTRKSDSCRPPFRSHEISWGVGQRCNACTWVVGIRPRGHELPPRGLSDWGKKNKTIGLIDWFNWLGFNWYRFVWKWVIWFQFSMASTDALGMV